MKTQLSAHIEQLKSKGLFRSLQTPLNNGIDFYSNDYLGLASHSFINESAQGSTGSRLISGNHPSTLNLENQISESFGFESALSFPSGYQANIGLISALGSKHVTYVYDEYCHASILDGMRLSFAQRKKFKHNDVQDLEHKLKGIKGPIIVIIEGRYSMDGDLCPFQEVLQLKQQYSFEIIIDEAHSLGTIASDYRGLVAKYQAQEQVLACVYTFGKALGFHGAVICGSDILQSYLINTSRSFIFSTGISPSDAQNISHRLDYLKENYSEMCLQLSAVYQNFSSIFKGFNSLSYNEESPIQYYTCGTNEKALQLSSIFTELNIQCKAIRYPTVPKGREGVRIVLHCYNSKEELMLLKKGIEAYEKIFY